MLIYILGESGTGKSASMRNLDPKKTAILQFTPKPLPFKGKDWQVKQIADKASAIASIKKASESYPIIILDDFQYLMSFMLMDKAEVKGYDKFTEIAKAAYDVLKTATESPAHVYVLWHTYDSGDGVVRTKTIGKMLDEKITPEGLATIVLRTDVDKGVYRFSTRNNNDTVKTPIGMFEDEYIDNDLAMVDKAIVEYYK